MRDTRRPGPLTNSHRLWLGADRLADQVGSIEPAGAWSPPSGSGATAGVVERSSAWLLGFRRLGVRYDWRADILQGLLHLACALVCLRSHPT